VDAGLGSVAGLGVGMPVSWSIEGGAADFRAVAPRKAGPDCKWPPVFGGQHGHLLTAPL